MAHFILKQIFTNVKTFGFYCHSRTSIHTIDVLNIRNKTSSRVVDGNIKPVNPSFDSEKKVNIIDHLNPDDYALKAPYKAPTTTPEHNSEFPPNDLLLMKLIAQEKNRKQREKKCKLILEGPHLIQTAIRSGIEFDYIFYSNDNVLSSEFTTAVKEDAILKVRKKTLKFLCDNKTIPQLLGVCPKPIINETTPVIPVTVLCSNVRDPSNLGSIVSIAAAAGCKELLLTSGCTDVWEHKVLNSAFGAHFHIKITNNIDWSEICNFLPNHYAFYVADSSSGVEDYQKYTKVNFNENEGIPTINFLNSGFSNSDSMESSSTSLQEMSDYEIPCHMYCSVAFPNKDIVVYVGGETEGVDEKVEHLIYELQGQKIKIPVENGMDSLNVSSALSIILFEIKRQFEKDVKSIEKIN